MAEAIRIGDPAIEVRLRRNARARRMVLRVARSGGGPTLTLPPGVPLAQRARVPRRPRGLAPAATSRPAPPRRPVGDGHGAAVRRRHPDGAGAARAAGCARAGGELLGARAGGRLGPRVAAWLREEARRGLRRRRSSGTRRRSGSGPGASACAIRARAGARAPRRGDLMFSWRLVMAPPAVLDYVVAARGGAPRRAEPLAAVLGGGAPPLPGLSRRRAAGCGGNGAGLHALRLPARRLDAARRRRRARQPAMIERERLSESLLPAHERVYRTPAGAGHARPGGAGRGADAPRRRRRVRGQHDAGARGGAAAGRRGGAEALGLGPGLDARADQRAHRGAGGAPGAARARARLARAAAGARGADRPDGGDQRRRSTR